MLMATFGTGTVGVAPGTTTITYGGIQGLGAQCPPAVLPINIAPDQSGGAAYVGPETDSGRWYSLQPYGSEVEMKGLSGSLAGPFSLSWATFLGVVVGSLALGAGITYLLHTSSSPPRLSGPPMGYRRRYHPRRRYY